LQLTLQDKISWHSLKQLLAKDHELLTRKKHNAKIDQAKSGIKKLFAYRADLGKLWERSNLTREELLSALQIWCKKAEASGIQKLQVFSLGLRASY